MFSMLTMQAQLWQMTGEAWVRQLRFARIVFDASMQQSRVIWGLSHPPVVANLCAPMAAPVGRKPRETPAPEIEDVPV